MPVPWESRCNSKKKKLFTIVSPYQPTFYSEQIVKKYIPNSYRVYSGEFSDTTPTNGPINHNTVNTYIILYRYLINWINKSNKLLNYFVYTYFV